MTDLEKAAEVLEKHDDVEKYKLWLQKTVQRNKQIN